MFQRRRRDRAEEHAVRRAIERQPVERVPGMAGAGVGGVDAPGYSISAFGDGRVRVMILTDQADQIGFVLEPDIARRFFERGMAVIEGRDELAHHRRVAQN